MMLRKLSVVLAASLALAPGFAGQTAKASEYDHLVAKHAAANGVPESLVRRVIHIESRGNPRVVSAGNYGLMQIRLGTARAMGYSGGTEGLLDADTNMTYAVKYLAGAYRAAGGNHEQAIRNYQKGYYYEAKRQGFSPYAVASAPPQAATPDPSMLPQPSDRQQVAAQQRSEREMARQARIEQQQAAEAARAGQRQAILQERAAQREAAEQQRAAQRQAALQQKVEREQANQPQQRAPSAPQTATAVRRTDGAQGYSWYNPMRFFKHPSHESNPYRTTAR